MINWIQINVTSISLHKLNTSFSYWKAGPNSSTCIETGTFQSEPYWATQCTKSRCQTAPITVQTAVICQEIQGKRLPFPSFPFQWLQVCSFILSQFGTRFWSCTDLPFSGANEKVRRLGHSSSLSILCSILRLRWLHWKRFSKDCSRDTQIQPWKEAIAATWDFRAVL